jgi:nitrite reductase/ring-hydroxylating ferredoxin subunit
LDEIEEDILLVRAATNKFYAIDARCSHEGGPLDQGDIEELGEKLLIVCPWHSFDFDLKNGQSSTGLKVTDEFYLIFMMISY